MTLGIDELPDDVLLKLLGHCELDDVLAFCATCKGLRALLDQPTVWIYALRRTRQSIPLACPFHADLSAYSLPELKRIAHQTLRRMRNWRLPKPKLYGTPRKARLEAPKQDIIFQVPGTALYLLHSRTTGIVTCWDAGQEKTVCPSISVAEVILDVTPGRDEPGCFTMGLLTRQSHFGHDEYLIIVSLHHQSDGHVSLSVDFKEAVYPFGWHSFATFWTQEIIGVLVQSGNGNDGLHILVYEIKSKRRKLIATDIPGTNATIHQSGTTTVKDDLFIIEEDGQSNVYRVPGSILSFNSTDHEPSVLPAPGHETSDSTQSTYKIQLLKDRRTFEWDCGEGDPFPLGALSSACHYGVPALSIQAVVNQIRTRSLRDEESMDEDDEEEDTVSLRESIYVKFWTVEVDEGWSEGKVSTRPKAQHLKPRHALGIQGELVVPTDATWQLLILAHSGRGAIMLIDVGDKAVLQLATFHEDGCTTHQLEVPDDLDLWCTYGLTIDDHRGVVAILDNHSCLYELPYA
ncbi:hypothetical protein CC1G_06895 [Coprinopsis cinerea okayama7|uniref:F-box domain-containing protein n=1 Tax=Coprinopsis cinerea (strain Okayama-7 / 130 / ATCC MYA-4618 / FGSC 9003) TaxID=240176 RepID=A8N723_COPC7|nr:hypothetical protein CC1G_06895 [Coprinopsis cinerea okayama7\|eukprot:XP_001830629.2 hypothetical protein CC1G_06895 [Coprinopsis cinerea okayama7\